MSRQIPKRGVAQRKEDQTGAISQSVPANFGSSIHPPATPYIRPAFGDEKEIPPLTDDQMPDPSPSGNSILDTMSGSFSLKNDRQGFMPTVTMSMPERGAEFIPRGHNGVEDLTSNFRILSIIDESAETGKDDNPNQDDVEQFGDDNGDGGVFGDMEMEMDEE